MEKKKKKIIIGVILSILFLFIIFNIKDFSKKRTIARVKGVDAGFFVEDFHITNKSIFLWGDNKLAISDKEGSIFKKIELENEKLYAFFANNYAFLYDKDLGKVYEYSEVGEHLNTISLKDELFNVDYENGNFIFHIKSENRERLFKMSNDGSLSEIYSTDNLILTHDIFSRENYAISELQISEGGYRSIVNIKGDKPLKKDVNNEIVMFIKKDKKSTLFLTNKNLYRIIDKENYYMKEVPNISDILVDGKTTYLLHSGILSKYNYKLEEDSKKIIAANVNKLEKISSSIYVLGPSDIGGEVGKKGEFYSRLGYSIDKIKINALTIGALKDGDLSLYVITDKRANEGYSELDSNYKEG